MNQKREYYYTPANHFRSLTWSSYSTCFIYDVQDNERISVLKYRNAYPYTQRLLNQLVKVKKPK